MTLQIPMRRDHDHINKSRRSYTKAQAKPSANWILTSCEKSIKVTRRFPIHTPHYYSVLSRLCHVTWISSFASPRRITTSKVSCPPTTICPQRRVDATKRVEWQWGWCDVANCLHLVTLWTLSYCGTTTTDCSSIAGGIVRLRQLQVTSRRYRGATLWTVDAMALWFATLMNVAIYIFLWRRRQLR